MTPARVAAQAEQAAGEAAPGSEELPLDPLGRRTPEGAVAGLMAAQDYPRAAQFLDLGALPRARRTAQGPLLARQLQTVLDQAGWVRSPRQLSNAPEGHLDDGLAPELDVFAVVRTPSERVPLLLERHDDPQLGQVWLVSAESVARVPALAEEVRAGLLEEWLPERLVDGMRIAGVPLAQWLALLALAAVAYLIAWLAVALAARALLRGGDEARRAYLGRFISGSRVPLRLFLAVWIFSLTTLALGVSIVARRYVGLAAEIIAWAALAWLGWRLIDAFSQYSLEKLTARGQLSAFSALRFLRRSAKLALVVIAAMLVLETAGFNITAGLAALGIGGIAIALGAQKTVENLIGGLTLIVDRPVRVGDFCRFGDRTGTVEDIGMRSTRIRTNDRTVITVPNSEFSSLQIENFAPRDRFLFHRTLALRLDTTADQVRDIVAEFRELLAASPKIAPGAAVRFLGLGPTSLNVEVFCYVDTPSFDEFMEIQGEITLRMLDIVAASGTKLALPSQTVRLEREHKGPPETE